jgi:hypothetical protein
MASSGARARWGEDGGLSGAVESGVVMLERVRLSRRWRGEWRGTTMGSRVDKVGRADTQMES